MKPTKFLMAVLIVIAFVWQSAAQTTQSCANPENLPKVSSVTTTLECSQIFDDGATVNVGGNPAPVWRLTNSGTDLTNVKLFVDMSDVDYSGNAYGGLMIKGGLLSSQPAYVNWPSMGFALDNLGTPSRNILGASFLGQVISYTPGAEVMDMVILTKPSNNQVQERVRITGGGYVGINAVSPTAILHVNANSSLTTGIRFQNLATGNSSFANILVSDANGNIAVKSYNPLTTSCSTSNIIPVVDGSNSLACSQISDNGTTVAIDGPVGPTWKLTSGGTSKNNSKFWVDMSDADYSGNNNGGSFAGLMIKGGDIQANGMYNWPSIGFSAINTSGTPDNILGASILGEVVTYTSGSESMGLTFYTKPSNNQVQARVKITPNGSVCINTSTPRTFSSSGSYAQTSGAPSNGTIAHLDVNGLTFTNTLVVSSDQRFKTNIKTLDNALQTVSKLNGVSWSWKNEFENKNFGNLDQAGYIAQELEKIYPLAVVRDQDGYYAVNYNAIIPLLSEAIKELDAKVEETVELKAKIEALEEQLNKICTNGCLGQGQKPDSQPVATNTFSNNILYQNAPNPFSKTTTIKYAISTQGNAYITVMGLDGSVLKKLPIETPGEGSIRINGSELAAGTYVYSLYLNEEIIDSKIMVIVKD